MSNILLFNFCEQKFVQHGPITIAIDCNGFSLLIFEERFPNYASGPKSAPKRYSFWVRRLFNVCMRVSYAPNATILLVYTSAKIKISFIWKMDYFLPKSASSVSRSQTHLAKQKHIGWSIGFNSWTNWTLYGVIPRSLCKIRLNDVSEMFNCWERWWINVDGAFHTFFVTASIFSGVRTVFDFSRLIRKEPFTKQALVEKKTLVGRPNIQKGYKNSK